MKTSDEAIATGNGKPKTLAAGEKDQSEEASKPVAQTEEEEEVKAALPLRLVTYLVPSYPVELFETLAQYLEEALGCETTLGVESRFDAPASGRCDPFRAGLADLAFVTGAGYEQLRSAPRRADWQVLPVAAVQRHRSRGETLGYYADVVVQSALSRRARDFLDLRGANWATNKETSLSGHLVVLELLRRKGESVSFFGNILVSGSHLKSIEMVALRKADVAAVDSAVLAGALARRPTLLDDVDVVDSIGPLPPHPIMVRASLDDAVKRAVTDALLDLHHHPEWLERCQPFVARYESVTEDVFYHDHETRQRVGDASAPFRYY